MELCIEVRNSSFDMRIIILYPHSRQRCFDAIEEELLELKNEVAEESNSRMKMDHPNVVRLRHCGRCVEGNA